MTELLKRLQIASRTREPVHIISAFEPSHELRNLAVVEVDEASSRFLVRFPAGRLDKWYQTRFILQVHFADATVVSEDGEVYWQRILDRRKHAETWRAALRATDTVIDWQRAPSQRSVYLVDELSAFINGIGRTLYVAGNPETKRYTVFDASSKDAAERATALLGESYWELASTWLSTGFLWTAWLANAEEHETAAYSGSCFLTVVEWAAKTDSRVVNTFVAKSWELHQIIKKTDHLSAQEVDLLVKHGLIGPTQTAPYLIALQAIVFSDLRAILRASGVKVASREAAVIWAVENRTNELESSARRSASLSQRFFFIPPCGLTWQEWQQFRNFHWKMINTFCCFFTLASDQEAKAYTLEAMLAHKDGDA